MTKTSKPKQKPNRRPRSFLSDMLRKEITMREQLITQRERDRMDELGFVTPRRCPNCRPLAREARQRAEAATADGDAMLPEFSIPTARVADSRPEPGLRNLGAEVIRRAVEDAAEGSPVLRQHARYFLSDGEWLGFYCALAGVDPEAVRQRFRP